MNFLEERILKDGIIKEGNVLKVDSFLNHQMDIDLFNEIGREFKKRFEGKEINKILTIEASGNVCSGSGVIYTQMQKSCDRISKIPDAGRSCSYYRRFSCERMRSSGIDPDRSVRRRDSRRNRDRD